VWNDTTVSMNPREANMRGGASAKVQKPTRAMRLVANNTERIER
jgi:hypothetical protein